MIAGEHVCVDDSRSKSKEEINDNNDDYNNDSGGGVGGVVGNKNANLVTIAASALIDPSGGKAEESNSGKETVDEIDDDRDLKPAAKSSHFIIRMLEVRLRD